MPKTRRRNKTIGRRAASSPGLVQSRAVRYAGSPAGAVSMQNVVFSAMVALSFWGFSVFCLLFYTVDPNHDLYAAILALTALGWSFLMVRKWSRYRQQVGSGSS